MYREEYPRPSFVRKNWLNLNGKWDFEILDKNTPDNDYLFKDVIEKKIIIPFCPESELSGIHNTDFMYKLWYRKSITINKEQLTGRVILHFGAVDFESNVYINKKIVGKHKGGYVGFCFDITDSLKIGENTIDLSVCDDTQDYTIPSGKQSPRKDSFSCLYTRTTGIWQTVWLEFVNNSYITSCRIVPVVKTKTVSLSGLIRNGKGKKIRIEVLYLKSLLATVEQALSQDSYNVEVQIKDELNLWDINNPNLYDIKLELLERDEVLDSVYTYCGFRTIEIKDDKILLNGRSIFMMQVLDQGFYPNGIYTAPSVQDIEKDIDLAITYGFNGIRPHEKVFEEYYFYYADKKGILVWGEYPNWGCKFTKSNPVGVDNLINEWKEMMLRDYNHPSIIGWCPLNEAWHLSSNACDYHTQEKIYNITQSIDKTRLFIGSSGGDLYKTDLWDFHTYECDEEIFKEVLNKGKLGRFNDFTSKLLNLLGKKLLTKSQLRKKPIFVSEYGGLTYMANGKNWGYHSEYKTEDEFINKYIQLTTIAKNSNIAGICYTQLYDVEQEQNGLVKYDRTVKLSKDAIEMIRKCNSE